VFGRDLSTIAIPPDRMSCRYCGAVSRARRRYGRDTLNPLLLPQSYPRQGQPSRASQGRRLVCFGSCAQRMRSAFSGQPLVSCQRQPGKDQAGRSPLPGPATYQPPRRMCPASDPESSRPGSAHQCPVSETVDLGRPKAGRGGRCRSPAHPPAPAVTTPGFARQAASTPATSAADPACATEALRRPAARPRTRSGSACTPHQHCHRRRAGHRGRPEIGQE
jgi:hypothetical protein